MLSFLQSLVGSASGLMALNNTVRRVPPHLAITAASVAAILALFAVAERVGLPAASLAIVLFAGAAALLPVLAWRSRTLDPEPFLDAPGRRSAIESGLARAMPLFAALPLAVFAEGLMTAAPAALGLAFGALAGLLAALLLRPEPAGAGRAAAGRCPPAIAALLVAVAFLLALAHLRSVATFAPMVFAMPAHIAIPLTLAAAGCVVLLGGRGGAARLEPVLVVLAVGLIAVPAVLLLIGGQPVAGLPALPDLASAVVPGMRAPGWAGYAASGVVTDIALALIAGFGVAGAMLATAPEPPARRADTPALSLAAIEWRALLWPSGAALVLVAGLVLLAGAMLLALRGLPGRAVEAASWPLAAVQFGALRLCGALPQGVDALLLACGQRATLEAADIAVARPLAPFAGPVLLGWPVIVAVGGALGAVALALAALIRLLLSIGLAAGRDLYAGLAERHAPRVRIVAVTRLAVLAAALALYFGERIAVSAADLTILALALSTATLAPAALAKLLFPGIGRALAVALAAGGAAFLVLFAFHVADPLGLVRITGMSHGFVAPVLAPLLAGGIGAGAMLLVEAGGLMRPKPRPAAE